MLNVVELANPDVLLDLEQAASVWSLIVVYDRAGYT
jgi:hypothetical protein